MGAFQSKIKISPLQQRYKRFSLNYHDLMNTGGGGEETGGYQEAPRKRFSMNYQDFLRQKETRDHKDKRFSMNYLDTLAVPVRYSLMFGNSRH